MSLSGLPCNANGIAQVPIAEHEAMQDDFAVLDGDGDVFIIKIGIRMQGIADMSLQCLVVRRIGVLSQQGTSVGAGHDLT